MGLPRTAAFLLAVIAVAMSAEGINEEVVFEERSFGLALTTHARTRRSIGEVATAPPRERNPIVYFYSRGGRQIRNRGAEVFHQLHDAVRREGILSYLEDGVDQYATNESQFIEDYTEIFDALGAHDVVVVTAISHALDEGIGALLTSYTGAPHLAQRARVVKWQIGFSFPSLEYFVDPEQLQICDTHWLSDTMGCAKEAYIRAPPLPLYYHAAARAAAAAGALGLASRKERLVLFDNDFSLDTARIKLREGCVLQQLDGLSREAMIDAYTRAVAVIDLWMPGAETVTAEGAMFDCCVLVPREVSCLPGPSLL